MWFCMPEYVNKDRGYDKETDKEKKIKASRKFSLDI